MNKKVESMAEKVIIAKKAISRAIGKTTIFLVVVKLFGLIQVGWVMIFLPLIIAFPIFFTVRILEYAFVGYACLNIKEKDNKKMFLFFRKVIKG